MALSWVFVALVVVVGQQSLAGLPNFAFDRDNFGDFHHVAGVCLEESARHISCSKTRLLSECLLLCRAQAACERVEFDSRRNCCWSSLQEIEEVRRTRAECGGSRLFEKAKSVILGLQLTKNSEIGFGHVRFNSTFSTELSELLEIDQRRIKVVDLDAESIAVIFTILPPLRARYIFDDTFQVVSDLKKRISFSSSPIRYGGIVSSIKFASLACLRRCERDITLLDNQSSTNRHSSHYTETTLDDMIPVPGPASTAASPVPVPEITESRAVTRAQTTSAPTFQAPPRREAVNLTSCWGQCHYSRDECWCDFACEQNNDCCDDYWTTCPLATTTTTTTTTTSDADTSSEEEFSIFDQFILFQGSCILDNNDLGCMLSLTLAECLTECWYNPGCKSLDFKSEPESGTGRGVCCMTNITRGDAGSDWSVDCARGYDYYEKSKCVGSAEFCRKPDAQVPVGAGNANGGEGDAQTTNNPTTGPTEPDSADDTDDTDRTDSVDDTDSMGDTDNVFSPFTVPAPEASFYTADLDAVISVSEFNEHTLFFPTIKSVSGLKLTSSTGEFFMRVAPGRVSMSLHIPEQYWFEVESRYFERGRQMFITDIIDNVQLDPNVDIDGLMLSSDPFQNPTFSEFANTSFHFADDGVVKIKVAVQRSFEDLRISEGEVIVVFRHDVGSAIQISDQRILVMSLKSEGRMEFVFKMLPGTKFPEEPKLKSALIEFRRQLSDPMSKLRGGTITNAIDANSYACLSGSLCYDEDVIDDAIDDVTGGNGDIIDDIIDGAKGVISGPGNSYSIVWGIFGGILVLTLLIMHLIRQMNSFDTNYDGECFPSDLLYLVVSVMDTTSDVIFIYEFAHFYSLTNTKFLVLLTTFIFAFIVNIIVVSWVVGRKSRIPAIEKRFQRVGKKLLIFAPFLLLNVDCISIYESRIFKFEIFGYYGSASEDYGYHLEDIRKKGAMIRLLHDGSQIGFCLFALVSVGFLNKSAAFMSLAISIMALLFSAKRYGGKGRVDTISERIRAHDEYRARLKRMDAKRDIYADSEVTFRSSDEGLSDESRRTSEIVSTAGAESATRDPKLEMKQNNQTSQMEDLPEHSPEQRRRDSDEFSSASMPELELVDQKKGIKC